MADLKKRKCRLCNRQLETHESAKCEDCIELEKRGIIRSCCD